MKTLLIFLGLMTAGTVIYISSQGVREEKAIERSEISFNTVSPEFKWTQVAPPGSGTHQHEWKPGTYPSAIVPLVAFNNDLWMIGQKMAWTSKNGIQWEMHKKHDWGERISMSYVYFNNRFWISGGMDYPTNTLLNEIWSSADGKTWARTVTNAEWSPRKGHTLVVFNNKLWLFGGEVSVNEDKTPKEHINDIWSSTDGIRWTKVLDTAPWNGRFNPRLLVFKDRLWLVGGQGESDIWRSDDGKNWTQVKTDCPWKDRYDYGAIVFDNLMWVYGGRESNARNAYKDVWFSIDGSHWQLQTGSAPWTPRSGNNSVVFKDKLWLYGGKHTGHTDSFSGDIWTMEAANRTELIKN
ncbi:MAG: hypothetical protein WD824_23245 [Cyclobacteriaceae bacterium]